MEVPLPIRNPRVLAALEAVPRHCFVPDALQREAYAERPLAIGFGQTISQPYVVAIMTELLDPEPDSKILEIGTGSGYQTAVLSRFTRDIYTIEIIEELHTLASTRLEKFGLGPDRVLRGDGHFGLENAAPFDRIIVTAAAEEIPPALTRQLKPGGRLVLPIGAARSTQRLVVVEKDERGQVQSRSVLPVQFVPMTGGPLEREDGPLAGA